MGSSSTPPPPPPPPPPAPPPNRIPTAPTVDAGARNKRDSASAQKTGTSIFRNDLAIPTGGSVGSGLNIPT